MIQDFFLTILTVSVPQVYFDTFIKKFHEKKSLLSTFDGFFRLKDSNEFTLINLLKWRSSSVTLVKPLLDVDDPPCCLWSQQLNLQRRDVRYGYFEFAKVLSKKPKMSIFENKLFFMDNPAVEIWASLAKIKLKSLNF